MSGERSASLPDPADLARRARVGLEASADIKRALAASASDSIAEAAALLIETLDGGHRVLAFGNGGSAADAQHFAAELSGRFLRERRALPALALTANSSDLTAIGNDYGFEQVFARLVEAHGVEGDLVVAISTSGNSANVIQALQTARDGGLRSLGLTGRSGGALAALVDVAVLVPSDETPRIQEAHIAVCHVLCDLAESALFPDAKPA